jgi:hypothetical protein
MYNRIIDHREKYPYEASQDTAPGDAEQSSHSASSQWDHSSSDGSLITDVAVYQRPFHHSDSLLDEEVFELDLWYILAYNFVHRLF